MATSAAATQGQAAGEATSAAGAAAAPSSSLPQPTVAASPPLHADDAAQDSASDGDHSARRRGRRRRRPAQQQRRRRTAAETDDLDESDTSSRYRSSSSYTSSEDVEGGPSLGGDIPRRLSIPRFTQSREIVSGGVGGGCGDDGTGVAGDDPTTKRQRMLLAALNASRRRLEAEHGATGAAIGGTEEVSGDGLSDLGDDDLYDVVMQSDVEGGGDVLDEDDGNDDERARMMMEMMRQHAQKIGKALHERSNLIHSIQWLGNHVPGCVLMGLVEEIRCVLREDQRRERRRVRRAEQRRKARAKLGLDAEDGKEGGGSGRTGGDESRNLGSSAGSGGSSSFLSDEEGWLSDLDETSVEKTERMARQLSKKLEKQLSERMKKDSRAAAATDEGKMHASLARLTLSDDADNRGGIIAKKEPTPQAPSPRKRMMRRSSSDRHFGRNLTTPMPSLSQRSSKRDSLRSSLRSSQSTSLRDVTEKRSLGDASGGRPLPSSGDALSRKDLQNQVVLNTSDRRDPSASTVATVGTGTSAEKSDVDLGGRRHRDASAEVGVAADRTINEVLGPTGDAIGDGWENGIDGIANSASQRHLQQQKSRESTERRRAGSFEGPRPLPYSTTYTCALLFVDISGFTKLSTLLDVESLSKAINSYFEKIVNEVTSHGGDILKFAGDALFAEWRVDPVSMARRASDTSFSGGPGRRASETSRESSSARTYNMSLTESVTVAATCGAKIVEACSDFPIYATAGPGAGGTTQSSQVATLNVHCGVGVGELAGVHVGDRESRREYLILGDPIDQVAAAEEAASLGELVASPQVIAKLTKSCRLDEKITSVPEGRPAVVAARSQCYFKPKRRKKPAKFRSTAGSPKPAESLAIECEGMHSHELRQLRKLISLYVHPVVVGDELTAETVEKLPRSMGTAQERHRAEAELRSVFVMFIMPKISAKLAGDSEEDGKLFRLLNDIMNVTTRELDRVRGHLRQFIVDDKGVVLIATFGLRGSTFPNMITERALPSAITIHEALQNELSVDNRVGCTIGNVYCGVVGGIFRHEFAVLGPSVNLAARLMASPHNPGILVDNAVRMKAGKAYSFKALPPVKAKGYKDPVPIFEPFSQVESRWGRVKPNFVGRKTEMVEMMGIAKDMVMSPHAKSKLVLLSAESGTGKSEVVVQTIARLRKLIRMARKRVIITRNISNEGDSRVPFSLFRSIFRDVLKELQSQTDDASAFSGSVGNLSLSLAGGDWDNVSHASHGSSSVMSSASTSFDRFTYICREMDAPPEFAEIVGNQMLGLQSARKNAANIDKKAKAPALKAIVDFMAGAFIRCTCHSDLAILALDDVHLMDEMSWKVVQTIFEQGSNVLVVCASRPLSSTKLTADSKFWEELIGKYQNEARFKEIELPPMDEETIQQMIAKVLEYDENEIDDDFRREVFMQSGGMPLFASEILENVKRNDLVERLNNGKIGWKKSSSTGGQAIFATIGELILHRVDSLEPSIRKVLQLAAVLGTEFELFDIVTVFEKILGVEDADRYENAKKLHAALEVAVQEGILDSSFDGGCEEDDEPDSMSAWNFSQSAGLSSSGLDLSPVRNVKQKHPYHAENKSYRFSHDMWKTNILNILLDSRKCDMHRSIALAIEAEQGEETNDYSAKIRLFGHWKSSRDTTKAAALALSIGEHFALLGLNSQSIVIYEDALDMWRDSAEKGKGEEQYGGVCKETLDNLGVVDLGSLIKVNIAMGKCLATLHKGKESVVAYQNALAIFHHAPAAEELKDRSIVFPIFSGLFVALKFGIIEQDKDCSYEQDLVRHFVKETKLNGDPVHYTRALAMQAEVQARLGHFSKALESHIQIEKVYDVDKHSAAVCKSYGSDRSGQSFAQRALCHVRLGDVEKGLEICQYVLTELMPKMDPKNAHNSAFMIYPILFILKDNGNALQARKAFDKFVVQAFNEHFGEGAFTFCLPLYEPLLMLLELAGRADCDAKIDNLDEYLQWALDEDNLRFSNVLNNSMANCGREANSINAEICLLLAKSVEDADTKAKLIQNGVSIARESVDLTSGKGGSARMINAYCQAKPVCDELEELAKHFNLSDHGS